MATGSITIHVDAEAARVYKSASDEERRKLEALVSVRLLEATKEAPTSLRDVLMRISRNAQERGIIEERLQEMLDGT